MKLSLFFLLSLFSIALITAQSTYSKIYDFGEGSRNYISDFEIHESEIFISSLQFCPITENEFINCGILNKLSLAGELLEQLFIDTFTMSLGPTLSIEENKILLTGHFTDELVERKTQILEFDTALNWQNTLNKNSTSDAIENNIGNLIDQEGTLYLYEKVIPNDSNLRSYISINKFGVDSIIWTFEYKKIDFNLSASDLQETQDSGLIFTVFYEPLVGNQLRSGYDIVKIDKNGKLLSTYSFEDINHQNYRLLSATDGSLYFPSRRNPSSYFESSNGRINKLNTEMDSILWSLQLPNDPISDGRIFITDEIKESNNGDILVGGRVWDNTDSEIPGGDIHSTYNGFICRVTTEGSIVWLRIFKHQNKLVDKLLFGKFRHSVLNEIRELSTGHILAAGQVYHTANQIVFIDESEHEIYHSWLILLDGNGCLSSENCDEIVYLDELVNTKEVVIEEVTIYPNPVKDMLHLEGVNRESNFNIYNTQGAMIMESQKNPIFVGNLPSGIYTLIITESTGNKIVRRFIR